MWFIVAKLEKSRLCAAIVKNRKDHKIKQNCRTIFPAIKIGELLLERCYQKNCVFDANGKRVTERGREWEKERKKSQINLTLMRRGSSALFRQPKYSNNCQFWWYCKIQRADIRGRNDGKWCRWSYIKHPITVKHTHTSTFSKVFLSNADSNLTTKQTHCFNIGSSLKVLIQIIGHKIWYVEPTKRRKRLKTILQTTFEIIKTTWPKKKCRAQNIVRHKVLSSS